MNIVLLLAIPFSLSKNHPWMKGKTYLFLGLFTYMFAKVTEFSDLFWYNHSLHFISGHSLKHLTAALALFFITKCFESGQSNHLNQ